MNCFLKQERGCTAQCMAWCGTPEEPKCLLLGVAQLAYAALKKKVEVRYPRSAPPPEVNP
jgi:hypothetical protein